MRSVLARSGSISSCQSSGERLGRVPTAASVLKQAPEIVAELCSPNPTGDGVSSVGDDGGQEQFGASSS